MTQNGEITIFQSDPGRRGVGNNATGFTKKFVIKRGDTAALAEAVKFDNCLAEYKNGHRTGKNFERANGIMVDNDNNHSNDPAEWVSPADVRAALPDVAVYQYPSRNNMKPKDGKIARPKFHNVIAIEQTSDAKVFTGYMTTLIKRFPQLHFDAAVKSPAQLNFGVEDAEVTFSGGEKTLTEFLEIYKEETQPPTDKKQEPAPRKARKSAIREGERNSTLSRRAGQLLKRYGDTEATRRRYDEVCKKCEPRLDDKEENTIYLSAQQFFHSVIEQSPSYKPADIFGAPPFAIPTDRGYVISAPLLADYYLERHTVIVVTESGNPRIFEYDGGVYKHRTDLDVRAELGGYITEFRRGLWSSGKIYEAYAAIIQTASLHVAQNLLNANPDIVCLKDGLLNIREWRLYPHTPDEYCTTQFDCCFAENIPDTPVYDKALSEYCEDSEEKARFIMQYKGAVFSNVPGTGSSAFCSP
jgi:hypothetical protein